VLRSPSARRDNHPYAAEDHDLHHPGPSAIGPYSQAVRVGSDVFTSGQVGLDPATGSLVAGGIREQTARVFENLAAVLEEAGLDLAHIVKTTVFLKSMADFAAMNEVYARYLAPEGVVPPAALPSRWRACPRTPWWKLMRSPTSPR